MDQRLQEDDELYSVELQRLVAQKFAVEVSPPTIGRYLCTALQWTVVRTHFRPMISENQRKRVEFARMCIDTMTSLNMLSGPTSLLFSGEGTAKQCM